MAEIKSNVITQVIIPKKNLAQLFNKLLPDYDIYGPVQKSKNDAYEKTKAPDKKTIDLRKRLTGNVFTRVESPDELNLEYTTTITPPKQFFLPSKEDLLRYELDPGGVQNVQEIPEESRPFILFGIHPCDMQGILRLDYVFNKDNPESNYLTRRDRSTIIGVNCVPDESCFCEAVNAQIYDEGFDIFLYTMGTSFLATVYTDKGREIISLVETKPVEDIDLKEKESVIERSRPTEGTDKFEPDCHDIPLLCKDGDELPFWDDIAARCFSCGTCNLVCPTCYCFDVNDVMKINLKEGTRRRFWDSCQLEDFAKVAGGENFRESRTQRQKHRFYRKFLYLMDEYHKPFCVGCGRCGRQCVADINIIETANMLNNAVENI
ncbi:MAG: 4Fe-4S dicluster domain-containing protein [Spirochaetota bacterium]